MTRSQCLLGIVMLGCSSFGCAEDPTVTRTGGPLPSQDGGAPNDSAAGGAANSDSSIPFCAALGVIVAKCQRCHGEPLQHGAPVPFLTYADTQAQYYATSQKWSDVMLVAVGRGFMPYVALNDPPTSVMPPVQPLTDSEKGTLVGWLQQGGKPEGGTDCPP